MRVGETNENNNFNVNGFGTISKVKRSRVINQKQKTYKNLRMFLYLLLKIKFMIFSFSVIKNKTHNLLYFHLI